jgi:hypothetical protein
VAIDEENYVQHKYVLWARCRACLKKQVVPSKMLMHTTDTRFHEHFSSNALDR